VRLFFAVELPQRVQRVLGQLRPPGGDEPRGDYRWSDPTLLHVTLAFLGEQPPERLDSLQTIGRDAARASRTGTLRLGAPGSFGANRAPRVLWVGLEGDIAALQSLQARLNEGLRLGGFDVEDRPFRPHITLARRRESARGGAPPGWPPQISSRHSAFPVEHLTLFQSRLSPRGPTYLPLFEFPCDAS
jgi:RNA 2',3'-cyclic 3'-phosphodiesterase